MKPHTNQRFFHWSGKDIKASDVSHTKPPIHSDVRSVPLVSLPDFLHLQILNNQTWRCRMPGSKASISQHGNQWIEPVQLWWTPGSDTTTFGNRSPRLMFPQAAAMAGGYYFLRARSKFTDAHSESTHEEDYVSTFISAVSRALNCQLE